MLEHRFGGTSGMFIILLFIVCVVLLAYNFELIDYFMENYFCTFGLQERNRCALAYTTE